MSATILFVGLLLLLGLPVGITITWYLRQRRQATRDEKSVGQETAPDELTFHWRYITLPLVILMLSIVLATYSYHLMPAEVAYRFGIDGAPQNWFGRQSYLLLVILPQLLLVLAAIVVTWSTSRLGRSFAQAASTLNLERVALVMGNMVILPQVVLAFVMLDIFSYNVYSMHLIPIWLFTLITMTLGGILLTIFFIQVYRQSRISADGNSQQNPQE
jgi:uncharacterized membrane protein